MTDYTNIFDQREALVNEIMAIHSRNQAGNVKESDRPRVKELTEDAKALNKIIVERFPTLGNFLSDNK